MATAVESTGIRWKKAKWVDIMAPKQFNEKKVGETFAKDVDKMLGTTVVVSVGNLTSNIKKQNLLVTLRLTKFEGEKAKTEIEALSLEKSYVSKLVRKGISKIQDSFLVHTKDGKKARVKPLIITLNQVSGSVAAALHHKQREAIKAYAAQHNFVDLLSEVFNFRIQNALKSEFDKIHPVRQFQILHIGLSK